MVPEAQLKDDGAGLVPASTGWFVMNARDARWFHAPGRGAGLPQGEERPLKQWDFVHFQKDGPWGYYCVDEVAAKYNASPSEDTQDTALAYARFEPA